jgi:hypothetical protein
MWRTSNISVNADACERASFRGRANPKHQPLQQVLTARGRRLP